MYALTGAIWWRSLGATCLPACLGIWNVRVMHTFSKGRQVPPSEALIPAAAAATRLAMQMQLEGGEGGGRAGDT